MRTAVCSAAALALHLLAGCASPEHGGVPTVEVGDVLQIAASYPGASRAVYRTASRVSADGMFDSTFATPVAVAGLSLQDACKVLERAAVDDSERIELLVRRDIIVANDLGYAIVVPYRNGITLADALSGQVLVVQKLASVRVTSLDIVQGVAVMGAFVYTAAKLSDGTFDRVLLKRGDCVVVRNAVEEVLPAAL